VRVVTNPLGGLSVAQVRQKHGGMGRWGEANSSLLATMVHAPPEWRARHDDPKRRRKIASDDVRDVQDQLAT
jgi:hypothetical protein